MTAALKYDILHVHVRCDISTVYNFLHSARKWHIASTLNSDKLSAPAYAHNIMVAQLLMLSNQH